MSFLKKLFGGGGSSSAKASIAPAEYQGFQIAVNPINEGGQFRVCAEISKEISGELKSHRLIRADVCANKDEADAISLRKAKQMIDEQGDQLFS